MAKTFIEFDLVHSPELKAGATDQESRKRWLEQLRATENGEAIYHTPTKAVFAVGDSMVITAETKNGKEKTLVTVDGNKKYQLVQDFATVKSMLVGAGITVIEAPSAPGGTKTLKAVAGLDKK